MMLAPLLAAAAAFTPQADLPYVYRIEQTRTADDGGTHRYVLVRRVIFRRIADGWLAELTLAGTDGSTDEEGRMFQRMAGALRGRPIRLRLDAAGAVIGIDDADAIWAGLVRGIAGPDDANGPDHAGEARAFAAFPPSVRRAFLASMLSPVIGTGDLDRAAAVRPVRIPASAPGAAHLTLSGEERASRAADGLIDVALVASGPLPGARPGSVRTEQRHRTDPSGIVVERRETRTIRVGERRLTIATVTTMIPPGN